MKYSRKGHKDRNRHKNRIRKLSKDEEKVAVTYEVYGLDVEIQEEELLEDCSRT